MNISRIDLHSQDSFKVMDPATRLAPSLAQNSTNIEDQRVEEFSKEEQEKLEAQIKKLNESIAASGKELKFKYNEEAKQLYVEVLNIKTKEVMTSLPPEFLIDLSIKMKEMIGMFMDEKI